MRLPLTPFQSRVAKLLLTRTGPDPTALPAPDTPADHAAVAVILAPDPDSVLLIRRAERLGDPWSGHMGLPGGRKAPDDPDLLITAMRETVEEVGYSLSHDGLLGSLPDVWPRSPLPRLIVVRPYVFAIPSRPRATLSDEVASAFWIPFAELRAPGVYRDTVVHILGEDRPFPAYHLDHGVVWGLTERILTSLLELLVLDQ